MPFRNTKSQQLKKIAKNTIYPDEFLWPEVSFSTICLKNMKKKCSCKSSGEATISYS